MSEEPEQNGALKLKSATQIKHYRGFRTHDDSVKFDDDAKTRFLEIYARTGRMTHAAAAAGVTTQTVRNHMDSDSPFKEAADEAKGDYRDTVMEAVYMHAVEGVEEPIIGGQFKDEVVAKKRVWDTRLLAIEAKRVNPEYRDGAAAVNINMGVLVVPKQGMTIDEWEATVNQPREIDVSST